MSDHDHDLCSVLQLDDWLGDRLRINVRYPALGGCNGGSRRSSEFGVIHLRGPRPTLRAMKVE